jgi:hypothetical protein
MKKLTLCFLALAGLSVGLLSACTAPVNDSDTSCSGYLGCSSRERIVPPPEVIAATDASAPTKPINLVKPGMGCGSPPPANQAATVVGTPKGYTRYTVMGTGANLTANPIAAKAAPRTFWVRVPADYDPTKAYRVVYVGQGCGGFDSANTNTLPLFKESEGGNEQAIYVAIDIPKDGANMDCYDNRDGVTSQEWEAFELFHKVVDANYCVDNNRIYISGYSTGGWLSNMWGCYFGGDGAMPASNPAAPRKFAPTYHIRGQAAVTGGEPDNNPACNGPVAAIWIHDSTDTGNPISGSYLGCARALKMNGCKNTATCEDVAAVTTPWHPEIPDFSVCRQYSGCPVDYPVVFCKTAGLGHADQAAHATAAFNLFFNMLNPGL